MQEALKCEIVTEVNRISRILNHLKIDLALLFTTMVITNTLMSSNLKMFLLI